MAIIKIVNNVKHVPTQHYWWFLDFKIEPGIDLDDQQLAPEPQGLAPEQAVQLAGVFTEVGKHKTQQLLHSKPMDIFNSWIRIFWFSLFCSFEAPRLKSLVTHKVSNKAGTTLLKMPLAALLRATLSHSQHLPFQCARPGSLSTVRPELLMPEQYRSKPENSCLLHRKKILS